MTSEHQWRFDGLAALLLESELTAKEGGADAKESSDQVSQLSGLQATGKTTRGLPRVLLVGKAGRTVRQGNGPAVNQAGVVATKPPRAVQKTRRPNRNR